MDNTETTLSAKEPTSQDIAPLLSAVTAASTTTDARRWTAFRDWVNGPNARTDRFSVRVTFQPRPTQESPFTLELSGFWDRRKDEDGSFSSKYYMFPDSLIQTLGHEFTAEVGVDPELQEAVIRLNEEDILLIKHTFRSMVLDRLSIRNWINAQAMSPPSSTARPGDPTLIGESTAAPTVDNSFVKFSRSSVADQQDTVKTLFERGWFQGGSSKRIDNIPDDSIMKDVSPTAP